MSVWDGASPFDGPEVVARRRTLRLTLSVLLVAALAGAYHAIAYLRAPPPADESARFADLAPFVEFTAAGDEGWFARVPDDWVGRADGATLDAVCSELLLRLAPSGNQTVTITDSEAIVRECRRPGQ